MFANVAVRAGLRMGAMAAVVVAVLAGLAAPASAHTLSGPRPANYRTQILSVTPEVPGVHVRVVDLGSKLELTNRTDQDVVVFGYQGEPYLRVGPDGVFENVRSQATYLNRSRYGAIVPPDVDTNPTAPPEWHKIGDGNSVTWHDHRIHWMSPQLPPQAVTDPGHFHRLSVQHVPMEHAGQRIDVKVALDWVPAGSALPWVPVVVVLFVLGVVAAVRPGWYRVLAALLIVLVVTDIVHAVAYEIPRPGGNLHKTLQFLGGGFVSVAVWIAAVPTVIGVLRRRAEALYGVMFVGLMIALVGGASDLAYLWKSQLPVAGPHALARLEICIALGLGLGVTVGAVVRAVRTTRASQQRAQESGRWLSLLVTGLDDAELARVAHDLDADEVLQVATRELAIRLAPVADAFLRGALVLIVRSEDAAGPHEHVWSFERVASGEVSATRGRADVVAGELRASFPIVLRVLAGSLAVATARTAGAAVYDGDDGLLTRVAPFFAERDVVVPAAGPAAPVTPAGTDPASGA